MANNHEYSFHLGLVTARDPSTLREGELQRATGCEYREGSSHVYKLSGRTSTSTALGAAVRGLRHLQYDDGTSKLVAVANDSLYEGNATTTPSMGAAVVTGLSTTATPYFSMAQERAVFCNGYDENRYRDSAGTWYTPLNSPASQPVLAEDTTLGVSTTGTLDTGPPASGNTFTNPSYAVDDDTATSAIASFNRSSGATIKKLQIKFPTTVVANATAYIRTKGTSASVSTKYSEGVVSARLRVYYNLTGSTTIGDYTLYGTYEGDWDYTTSPLAIPLTGVTDLINVRFYFEAELADADPVVGTANVYVSEVFATTGGTQAYILSNPVDYCYTERYYDADNVLHESAFSEIVTLPVTGNSIYGVTITLPTSAANASATEFGIYRSVDTDGGGYPLLYYVTSHTVGTATAHDYFSAENDPTLAPSSELLSTVEISSPDGTTLYFPANTPPPVARATVVFQGSMVYLTNTRQVRYSLPFVYDPAAVEYCPEPYYLEFDTSWNDTPTAAITANGGKAILMFFQRYTMLITYLPQAADGGIFNRSISEYVSNTRGCSGLRACTEFTLPSGQTLVASADALGLWVTDGISTIQEWSRDLDWSTIPEASRPAIELVDNTEKRRLELLYVDSNNARQEYHFFYARAKQDGDGQTSPLITGPHPTNVRTKHFSNIDAVWIGWGGDSTATGDIYIENTGDADASEGYATGSTVIPYDVESGDKYLMGLGGAHVIEYGYPKFVSGTKNITVVGKFRKDSGSDYTLTKTFAINSRKKIYWHKYADRHSIRFQDYTNTSLPALVAYEAEVMSGGKSRE